MLTARVSGINVVEFRSAENVATRRGLLATARRLTERKLPAAFPSELLARSLKNYRLGVLEVELSIRDDQDGLWYPMEKSVEEVHRQELPGYKREQEAWYRKMHDKEPRRYSPLSARNGFESRLPLLIGPTAHLSMSGTRLHSRVA